MRIASECERINLKPRFCSWFFDKKGEPKKVGRRFWAPQTVRFSLCRHHAGLQWSRNQIYDSSRLRESVLRWKWNRFLTESWGNWIWEREREEREGVEEEEEPRRRYWCVVENLNFLGNKDLVLFISPPNPYDFVTILVMLRTTDLMFLFGK